MTTQQLTNRLQEILTNTGISLTSLTDQANFSRDLGLDSLDVTDLLLQVECSFGIRIPDEEWYKIRTIGQLKAYLADELLIGVNSPGTAGTVLLDDIYAIPL